MSWSHLIIAFGKISWHVLLRVLTLVSKDAIGFTFGLWLYLLGMSFRSLPPTARSTVVMPSRCLMVNVLRRACTRSTVDVTVAPESVQIVVSPDGSSPKALIRRDCESARTMDDASLRVLGGETEDVSGAGVDELGVEAGRGWLDAEADAEVEGQQWTWVDSMVRIPFSMPKAELIALRMDLLSVGGSDAMDEKSLSSVERMQKDEGESRFVVSCCLGSWQMASMCSSFLSSPWSLPASHETKVSAATSGGSLSGVAAIPQALSTPVAVDSAEKIEEIWVLRVHPTQLFGHGMANKRTVATTSKIERTRSCDAV